MSSSKLENIEAIALIVIIMANKIILNIPKDIIISTASSAWLNVLYIGIISIIFAYIVSLLFQKFPGEDILDVSYYLGGNCLKSTIGILHIIFLTIIPILIIRNFSETLKVIYFTESPIYFLMIFLILAACIANIFGLKVIAKVNLIITPIVLLNILVILFSSPQSFVFQRLFPILGYGINKTFFSGLTNLFGFSGLAYLLFLQPFLKRKENFKKISIISLTISTIYLLLSVICLLLVFSYHIESNENSLVYLLTRMVRYGDFIQRADAIFILIWVLSVISYISISLCFLLYILKKITKTTDTNSYNYCLGSIFLGCSLLPLSNFIKYKELFSNFFKYSMFIFIFIINFLILILANIKSKLTTKKAKN